MLCKKDAEIFQLRLARGCVALSIPRNFIARGLNPILGAGNKFYDYRHSLSLMKKIINVTVQLMLLLMLLLTLLR